AGAAAGRGTALHPGAATGRDGSVGRGEIGAVRRRDDAPHPRHHSGRRGRGTADAVTARTGEVSMFAPCPPFDDESARRKVQAAEDAWNTRDPERVALAYTDDSVWRNRDEFITGRAQIAAFLRRKWERERDYALRKELWCHQGNRIAVRYQYESRDLTGQGW